MYAVAWLGLPWWLRQPACNAGDLGSIPGPERSPGKGKGLVIFLCLAEGGTRVMLAKPLLNV